MLYYRIVNKFKQGKSVKQKNISEAMKEFWGNKKNIEVLEINIKRSNALKNKCIWMKKENEKPFPCNIELILSKLSEGYLIVNTIKNREKVESFFQEFPEFFYAKENKRK